jgi:primosomal protein N' (replication factor Y)
MTSSPELLRQTQLWKVAVNAPLFGPLTYEVPIELENEKSPERGQSVLVPLGRRKANGVLLEQTHDRGEFKLRSISGPNTNRFDLPNSFLKWLEWLAQYYIHPIGQVVESVFPPLLRSSKTRKSKRAPVVASTAATIPPSLSDEQAATIRAIESTPGFATHLVHGVTGSGKTEIYIRLLEKIVAQNLQGIVLVPEISLTPQLTQRFTSRFGDQVAVIHSHLTPREKTTQWWAMVENKKKVLIGARSALFCPAPHLGMIIVDEEHEGSFKQDEKLKYHARDAAIMLGKFSNCPVVLGSATPSLESWANAKNGRFKLHTLKFRVENRPMPKIEVVDLKSEREERKLSNSQASSSAEALPFWLSEKLFEGIETTLQKNQQVALFLNRRGIAQSVLCPSCGYVPECPNCAVSLTLHGRNNLLCHYCDFHETLQFPCKDCKEGEPKAMGLGTELIENDLRKLFPLARLVRMDRDEIAGREDLERTIREIENREVDIIIGTQMIAKGLDFPGLTLVGLVLADVAFNLPDFRAGERAFQLLTQVAGRSGRHLSEEAGRVLIQTYNPEHSSILFTQAHDYEGFADYELSFRNELGYPPIGRLAAVRIQGLDLDKVKGTAFDMRDRARELKSRHNEFSPIEILGPAEAPLARLRGQHRYQILIKGTDAQSMGQFCRALMQNLNWVPGAIKVNIDMDAINLL